MVVDHLFFLAVGAIGWGVSLATYRELARYSGWPLGAAQSAIPTLTLLVGILSALTGIVFAFSRGAMHGGLVILIFGIGLAVFWSGFLRVGAQSALLLAPLAAGLLIVAASMQALGY